MMFLQTFVWGAWYIAAPNYLTTIGFDATDIGWTYTVGPVAGIISPYFMGFLADRWISTQKLLGALNILAGLIMLVATLQMTGRSPSPPLINLTLFVYMLAFYPTLSLIVSLAMRHIANPQRDYPSVRVLGTVGFMVVSLFLTWVSWETSVKQFLLSAACSIGLGFYCFTLPATPPLSVATLMSRSLVGSGVLVLLKDRSFLIFLICTTLISIPMAFYYQIASRVVEMTGLPVGQTLSYGQMSELVFMLVMPLFFARLGVKWMLAMGMLSWVLRYALFAMGATAGVKWLIVAGILLHGVCYDFLIVTSQIYVDQRAPAPIRAQAQAMLVLFTLGVGFAAGAQIGGRVEQFATPAQSRAATARVQSLGLDISGLREKLESAPLSERSLIEQQIDEASKSRDQQHALELHSKNWMMIFGVPAGLAFAIALIFIIGFRGSRRPRPSGEALA